MQASELLRGTKRAKDCESRLRVWHQEGPEKTRDTSWSLDAEMRSGLWVSAASNDWVAVGRLSGLGPVNHVAFCPSLAFRLPQSGSSTQETLGPFFFFFFVFSLVVNSPCMIML